MGPLALHFAETSVKYIAFLQSMHCYLQLVGLSCQLVLPYGGKQQYVKFRAFKYYLSTNSAPCASESTCGHELPCLKQAMHSASYSVPLQLLLSSWCIAALAAYVMQLLCCSVSSCYAAAAAADAAHHCTMPDGSSASASCCLGAVGPHQVAPATTATWQLVAAQEASWQIAATGG